MVKCVVKLSVRHAWVWNPTARLHCDGNKIIFTIVIPSNVDVTNGGVHIATTLLDQKLPLLHNVSKALLQQMCTFIGIT